MALQGHMTALKKNTFSLIKSINIDKTNTKIKIDDLLEYSDILFRYFEVGIIKFQTVF